MTKAYHYLYFRTYEIISKTNKTSAESSTARFLSILFLINILTLYSLFFKSFNDIAFYSFSALGMIVSILNLRYFDNAKNKFILYEFKDLKINRIYKTLVDSYPYLSFIFLFSSLDVGFYAIYYFIGIVILIKAVTYFWNL
ncbi:hypothetical protein [Flavobacterium ginsenosidimutans]|uniref:hypothetical protein n=1 Tax=Flavobacterium ginsenosidimutans TaxID=687844 RepID=UPI000DADB554|nr:hypothetical protein [Flavobacterium ginsenosidimutans]KAF2326809.1 hypothetical protein DM444_23315 [Flavobacterium ginsenosidimutans]